jgi:hypothetical protein
VFDAESVTFTVTLPALSTAEGVPLMTPAPLRLRPTAERPVPETTVQL